MGTQVAKVGGGLLSLQDRLGNLDDKIQQVVGESGATLGSFFQFSGKTGEFKLNTTPIEYGTVFAFAIDLMQKGVICWKDEKPIKRELVYVLGNDPTPEAPEEQGDGEDWRFLMEVPVKTLDTGEQAVLGLSSKGGTRALSRLLAEWGQRVRMNMEADGKTPKVCLVEVSAEKFKTKGDDGKVAYAFAPRFKIVEWVDHAELVGGIGAEGVADAPAEEEVAEEQEVVEAPKAPAKAAAPAPAAARPTTGFGSGLRGVRK